MSEPKPSPSERIASSYQQLSAAAETLNQASDELGKWISSLDAALKKLNLGIEAWAMIEGCNDDGYGGYWSRDVGYAKVGRQWGIALRTTSGNWHAGEGECEEWLFNEAPRSMRAEAVDKVPDLIDRLIKEATATAQQINDKSNRAKELAAAITPPPPQTASRIAPDTPRPRYVSAAPPPPGTLRK